MTLREAILNGNGRAVVRYFDRARTTRGMTYDETRDALRAVFLRAGREVPSDAAIDGYLYEGDSK